MALRSSLSLVINASWPVAIYAWVFRRNAQEKHRYDLLYVILLIEQPFLEMIIDIYA